MKSTLARALESWFAANKRPMPWRRHPTPYACWLSEIMMQQTTYGTVLPYYERFLKRFPTVETLARAREEAVLKAWEGLGYYARARNLLKAARQVMKSGRARWPQSAAAWAELPGIGPYTAAALASVLVGERVPVVDGNVARVFSRVWTLTDDFSQQANRAKLAARLQGEIENARVPGDFNQAMMEMGATVCTPTHPACARCPLAKACAARRAGEREKYPVKAATKTLPVRAVQAVIVRDAKGRVLLVQNREGGLLKGLWELPAVEASSPVTQLFSHFKLELSTVCARRTDAAFKDPARVPLTTATRKALQAARLVIIGALCLFSGVWRAHATEWISVPEAPVSEETVQKGSRAAPGTSWFARTFTNAADVVSARWTVTGLGVFEAYANGVRVGNDFLKPGFTHWAKTKDSFTYDVTALLNRTAGAENVLAAEVSAGWWRDKTVTRDGHRGFRGRKSAFWGELVLTYANGRHETIATDVDHWRCDIAGAVLQAAIFDGETYDARRLNPVLGEGLSSRPEINREFAGRIQESPGGEVVLRRDLAISRGPFTLVKGERRVVDFGQNCAAVPEFVFRAKRGTVLRVLPGEMLNDADAPARGCDGPKGSVYRANLKIPDGNMCLHYTFAGEATETYVPRFTYFGYRYLSLEATDEVTVQRVTSVPVTSVTPAMEIGTLEVGDPALNQFVKNVRWGMLSNYLNVPTDCPQRNERLGWSADTQVFCEAGSFLADTRRFFAKYMRDMRDTCSPEGGFPSVAPEAQYGGTFFAFGWADAGVIVPWTVWRQFGDLSIVRENWEAMVKFVRAIDARHYDFEGTMNCIYADWLSYETFESRGNVFGDWEKWKDDPDARNYRLYLAACYWLYDARLMTEMAEALGRANEAAFFRESAARALVYIRERFCERDGLLLKPMRHLQTACVFALRHGVVTGAARAETRDLLVRSIRNHGGCLQTGFLGTSFILDALVGAGAVQEAYDLLLQHQCPSWLYSVDQGATTVWERWNSYTKKDGFGPARMNSFNHYAYGGVLAWMFRTVAGMEPKAEAPGFRRFRLAPKPDRRLRFCRATYRSAAGVVTSHWRYEGSRWVWEFSIPEGTTAEVTAPGDAEATSYAAGSHRIVREEEGR